MEMLWRDMRETSPRHEISIAFRARCHSAFAGSDAAAICAISSSFGGACGHRAERVAEHRLAERARRADHRRPVATSSSARSTFTRLPFSSPRNICPPPAPQQNDRSRDAAGSTTSADRPITVRGSS